MENQKKFILECVKNHDLESLLDLLKKNKEIDLRFTDSKGRTLIHHAVGKISQYGLPILQVLLESGIDPNAVDEKFESAMDVARNVNNVPGLTLLKYFLNKNNQELQHYL